MGRRALTLPIASSAPPARGALGERGGRVPRRRQAGESRTTSSTRLADSTPPTVGVARRSLARVRRWRIHRATVVGSRALGYATDPLELAHFSWALSRYLRADGRAAARRKLSSCAALLGTDTRSR